MNFKVNAGMGRAAHLTEEQFARFQNRILTPVELLDAHRHLAACEECRERLSRESGAPALLAGLRSQFSEHLEYGQIVAGAEGTADATVRQHLADCAMCRAEVEDLREFQGELQFGPEELANDRSDNDRSDNNRDHNLVQMPVRKATWRRLASFAVIAAGLVLTIGVSLRILRQTQGQLRPTGHTPEIAESASPVEPALRPDQQAAVQFALSTHALERAAVLDRLIAKRGVLLGAPGEQKSFAVNAPMGTSVLSDRPVFHWEVVPGASKYVVAIFDENFQRVAESPALAVNEWTPEPLVRAGIYNWQVTALVGGRTLRSPLPPAPEARFQVVGAEVWADIENTRREHPGNHLLLSVLLAKAGALDEVAAELDALAGTDAATAQALKESLKEIRKR